MRRTNKHSITWVKDYTLDADGLLVPAGSDYSMLLDIPKRLSERFGRSMPACATYEVAAARIWLGYNTSEALSSWSRLVGGALQWMAPTNERVKALKLAAQEFFSERDVGSGRQRAMQFYPRLTIDPVNPTPAHGTSDFAAAHMSRRPDGRYYTLAANTNASNWGVFFEYNKQNPPLAEPVEQTGAVVQDTRLYDQRAYQPIESVRTWRTFISHQRRMERAEAAGFQDTIVEAWSWTMTSGSGSLSQSEVFAKWVDTVDHREAVIVGPMDAMLGQFVVFPEGAYPRLGASQSTFEDLANRDVQLIVELDVTGWREMR